MPALYTIGIKTEVLKETVQDCAILSHPVAITARLKERGYTGFFILGTCNRFEIYSSLNNLHELCNVVFENHKDVYTAMCTAGYEFTGQEALLHLFRVTSGLESNLLGDYEITGQVKSAVKISKEVGCLNGTLERMVNAALSASKEVKAKTSICKGKISYASAAVELAIQKHSTLRDVPVIIYGLGKIGRSLLDYLMKQTDANNVTLCNRQSKHIQDCLEQYPVKFLHRDDLTEVLHQYPVIFVCTGATAYTLTVDDFKTQSPHLVFDLAFPDNVQPQVSELNGVELYAMKELEGVFAETIAARQKELPIAAQILSRHAEQYKADAYRRNQYLLDLQADKKEPVAPQTLAISI